jgi:hypothetical protein
LGHARGVAFVEMASAGDADKAITELKIPRKQSLSEFLAAKGFWVIYPRYRPR